MLIQMSFQFLNRMNILKADRLNKHLILMDLKGQLHDLFAVIYFIQTH